MEKKKQLNRLQGSTITGWIFFILTWLWASWWMGDIFRIAYEYSFFAPDATLMHWLWQRSFGVLWIIGRALLTLYRWPLIGGLFVAVLLTTGSWLLGYSLRLSQRWHLAQYLPAFAWMIWTAHVGLNLFYMYEPGRILSTPFVFTVACGVLALITFLFRRNTRKYTHSETSVQSNNKKTFMTGIVYLGVLIAYFAIPMIYLSYRHPYFRPLTRMQVQLLHNDYEGISQTAHKHADMCNRQMAGYYVIALARTGHLADQLFDIKLDFKPIRTYSYAGKPNESRNYHHIDCNYHAGLIRAAHHSAMEQMMMDGPSLFTLKHLAKISLLEGDWTLARKYLHIIEKSPFEGEFLRKYKPMAGHQDLVQADPEFAAILRSLPPRHTLENMFEKPCFIGYYAVLKTFNSPEALTWSAIACLYSKRMTDFLQRCGQFAGTMPPRSIAEGLVTQIQTHPTLLQAFPQLQMDVERYNLFLQDASSYTKDRERGREELFEKYHGYYPYYYFFGNISSAKTNGAEQLEHNRAGVN